MKTFISILLIISQAIPMGGSFLFLHIQKQIIKKEIKKRIIAGIDKNELVIHKFTKTETESRLKWEESGEYEYNGEMYDVVDSECNGDTVTYWCWWDREETRLNQRLSDMTARAAEQCPQNQENQRLIARFLLSLSTPDEFKLKTFFNFIFPADLKNSFHYISLSVSPPIPPP